MSDNCEFKIEREHGIDPEKYFWKEEDNNPRQDLWKEQQKQFGFDDRQLWGLDMTIATFVYPRLIRFKEIVISYPNGLTMQKWYDALDKMIEGFRLIILDQTVYTQEELDIQTEAIQLFSKYYFDLWD